MRHETGTFELRDSDMMMRELSSSEMDEVVGGTGTALVSADASSGTGSSIAVNGSFTLATSNTSALAVISENTTSVIGTNNTLSLMAFASA